MEYKNLSLLTIKEKIVAYREELLKIKMMKY